MFSPIDLSFSAKSMSSIYLVISIVCSMFGTMSSGIMSLDLLCSEMQYWEYAYYTLVTSHGTMFVFLVLAPVGQFYLNLLLPGLLGVEDFYLPSMNLGAAMGTGGSAIMLLLSSIMKSGPMCGWTFYPPLAYSSNNSLDFFLSGLHLLGMSGLLGSMNTLATTMMSMSYLNSSLMNMSFFVWCQVLTAMLFTGSAPGLVMAITGLLLDSSFGCCWFDPTGGGDPVLFQTLFWFFGHPEVYVMMLPAFGVMNMVFEEESSLCGSSGMLSSLICLGVMSFLVYGHHMFTVELETEVQLMFTSGTMSMAMPTGVKVFAWMFSLKTGTMSSPSNMSFTCFLLTFVGGGMTGMLLSSCMVDLLLHDTEFVVAHFHQEMAIAVVLGVSMGSPSISNKLNNKMNSYFFSLGLMLFTMGTILLFIPMYYTGMQGVPSSVPSYQMEYSMDMSSSHMGFIMSEMSVMIMGLSS